MSQSTIWEMDFNALPLRDDKEKRVWELLVCDTNGQFQQARYCSNQEVNSVWVAEQLKEYLALAPDPPAAVRVFRARMSSVLQRACDQVGIPMRASRRVYALANWMRQRAEQVYPNETRYAYKPDPAPLLEMERPDPVPLPDTLQGERWALVTLRAADLAQAEQWPIEFGETFGVDWEGLEPQVIVPGLLIASRRAKPLAAWMSGVEPAFIEVGSGSLILEAAQIDRYSIARFSDDKTRAEAEGFINRKQAAQGIHFLAIQTDLKAQAFAGFWLLQDLSQL